MKLFGVKYGINLKNAALVLVVASGGLSVAASVNAAEITDADSCSKAVQATEAQILKTDMKPDTFNQIVADADAAKAACSAGDFAKANELVSSISQKLASASNK